MSFVSPNILWLELAVFVLFVVLFSHKNPKFAIFDEILLEKLKEKNTYKQEIRLILLFLAMSLVVVSLARPVFLQKTSDKKNLVLLLDASLSMMAKDVLPNRFNASIAQIKKLLDLNEKQALVIYTKDCYVASGFTHDKDFLLKVARSANPYEMPSQGSDLTTALECVGQYFGKAQIVVFSDGGGLDLKRAKKISQKYNLRIFVIKLPYKLSRIPTQDGHFLHEKNAPVLSKFNEDLSRLSAFTGGTVSTNTPKLLQQISSQSTQIRQELFVYFLIAAIFCLWFAFFSTPAIFVLMLMLPIDARAFSLDLGAELRAREFYENHKYQEAIKMYLSIKDASKKQEQRIFYNIANAHFMLKNYQKAARFYERALKYGKFEMASKNLRQTRKMISQSPKKTHSTKYHRHKIIIKKEGFFLQPSKRGSSDVAW